MTNNHSVLQQAKSGIIKQNNTKYISQEAMIRLIKNESGVTLETVSRVIKAMQDITVTRFKNGQDVLIPGIMRIVPGEGGLTKRYIKIQSVSETLKERLK
jgi:hypothetical protein